jgi:hypothetical protein
MGSFLQFFSTSAYWTEEATATTTKSGTRIYKFVNTAERVGFLRDETYAATGYMSCGLGEGEHCYTQLTDNPLKRIVATLETTIDALDFIPWSQLWGCPMVDTSSGISSVGRALIATDWYYNLAGQRVDQPVKGLYIVRSTEGHMQGKKGKKIVKH